MALGKVPCWVASNGAAHLAARWGDDLIVFLLLYEGSSPAWWQGATFWQGGELSFCGEGLCPLCLVASPPSPPWRGGAGEGGPSYRLGICICPLFPCEAFDTVSLSSRSFLVESSNSLLGLFLLSMGSSGEYRLSSSAVLYCCSYNTHGACMFCCP